MPKVTEGSSVTLSVDERDIVSLTMDNAVVRYENPPGNFVEYIAYDKTLGPLSVGQIKLTAYVREFEYETGSQLVGDTDQKILAWAYAEAFRVKSATRNSDGAITTATIVWPDGTQGTYTADTLSTAFPGATDGWHASYGVKTVTQSAVTRDPSTGAVTAQPAITIA